MKSLRTVWNYLCYCGIEKDEYRELKKDAYVSNFEVWRVLHCLMTVVFAALFVASMFFDIMTPNKLFYLIYFAYSAVVTCLFLFVFRKDSIIAQLTIYLSISLLFLFGGLITKNKPEDPATTFIVFLLIAPMFMIDKPYFMGIELTAASVIFLIWMRSVKPYDVWRLDEGNVVVFTFVGFFIHIIANSVRIKEFVLAREISRQKDTDELTGIKNKGAVTRAINEYLADDSKNKGIMLLLDIDRFKAVNDTCGHDVGDSVISGLGRFLRKTFTGDEIVGRFGGDEFIVFIKDTDDVAVAERTAGEIIEGAPEYIRFSDEIPPIGVSIGAAIYNGVEKNYSEIFKKADVALYRTKADRTLKFSVYGDPARQ